MRTPEALGLEKYERLRGQHQYRVLVEREGKIRHARTASYQRGDTTGHADQNVRKHFGPPPSVCSSIGKGKLSMARGGYNPEAAKMA